MLDLLWDYFVFDNSNPLIVLLDSNCNFNYLPTTGVRFCCLSVAVCSVVAAGCVCMYCARCTCLHVCGMWDRPTNKVRTVDRVRVNG